MWRGETRPQKFILLRVESDPWDNQYTVPNSVHVLWVCGHAAEAAPSRAAESSNSRTARDPYGPHCGWNDVRCHCDGLSPASGKNRGDGHHSKGPRPGRVRVISR